MSLNKKRIGELYDLPIVTGDLNMVNNHELLLEMNDDNTPKALKQRVNGDLFKTILGEGSGGSTNPGYNVTKQTVTLFNDTIETQQSGVIYRGLVEDVDFDLVAGETYTVVFDGISYDVKAITSEDGVVLGEFNNEGPLFENYPFIITLFADEEVGRGMVLLTNIEGSHIVVIKHEEETVTTTPEFKSAVNSVTGYSIEEGYETLYDGTVEISSDGNSFSGIITPTIIPIEGDTYKVTFNGTEYICKGFNDSGYLTIGAQFTGETYDWSTYPFNIEKYSVTEDAETVLNTNQEGSCTLKIEHFGTISKITPAFESMIQGIAGGSTSGCQIIYPDSISWVDSVYSQYDKEPEAGNIYFIPYVDTTDRGYLYPVYINELINNDDIFSGSATIIGTPIITVDGTLTVLDFDGVINPSDYGTSGLRIYSNLNGGYRLRYKEATTPPIG